MRQPFKHPIPTTSKPAPAPVSSIASIPTHQWTREILLPSEIISQILTYIPNRSSSQPTFYNCCLVSRAWYAASITLLYSSPHLDGSNFTQFVTTVCPSKNAHIRLSTLATLVRKLDMGELVHNSSRSLTARLLGRLKHNLEAFIAPQASFAINSFAALSKCTRLTYLDLSLISASISNKLLFQTLKSLTKLTTLFFPRSSSLDSTKPSDIPYTFPPRLAALHLAGGIDDHFLRTHLTQAPSTLHKLSIQHCSQIYTSALLSTLTTLGPQLAHLTIRHPMTKLPIGALDNIFSLCPSLIALRISADYISNELFITLPSSTSHPLQILDLECSPQATAEVGISPSVVYEAVESGKLSSLRSVRVSARLAWVATEGRRQDIEDLVEAMSDLEMESPKGVEVGVWASLVDL